jgi:hypothetical protein
VKRKGYRREAGLKEAWNKGASRDRRYNNADEHP